MNKKQIFLFLLLQLLLSGNSYAGGDSLYFFDTNLLFKPTETSIFEAKNGVTKYTDKKNLKLDIGATIDLVGLNRKKNRYSFGVDFFTFSNLRSEANFKFPVDAIDYMFGINFNMKQLISDRLNLSYRLRVSHISSHFEDGHKYENTDTIFTPVVFSKEFTDLAAVSEYELMKNFYVKNMLAVNFIFHSIPDNVSELSGQFGIETDFYFTKIFGAYFSADLTLAGVNSNDNLNINAESGIILGSRNSRSLIFYFSYYDGQDYRGQYYGKYLNNKGLGLRIKL